VIDIRSSKPETQRCVCVCVCVCVCLCVCVCACVCASLSLSLSLSLSVYTAIVIRSSKPETQQCACVCVRAHTHVRVYLHSDSYPKRLGPRLQVQALEFKALG